MKYARGLVAGLVLFGIADGVQAQPVIGYPGGIGFGGTIYVGRLRIGYGGFIPPPPYGFYGPGPFGYSSRTTVVQIYSPPPPPIVFAPPLLAPALPDPILLPRRPVVEVPPEPEPQPPPAERPLPGAPAGRFRPLRPEDRARAEEPVKPPEQQPKPPMPPPELKPKPPDAQPPALPRPPQPQADPRAENARLVELGRLAFAAGEYGRAAHRFRQATAAAPDEPLAYLLLGQALFALEKYGGAVEALRSGMRLQPDWPLARFRPLELHGAGVADYPDLMRRLEDALARHPNDPVLLFLYGYQLWFDGRKEEARPVFQRALMVAPPADRPLIERFLHAMPGAPVV
jgi:hypothetical protein